jgi:hypothetical protein
MLPQPVRGGSADQNADAIWHQDTISQHHYISFQRMERLVLVVHVECANLTLIGAQKSIISQLISITKNNEWWAYLMGACGL